MSKNFKMILKTTILVSLLLLLGSCDSPDGENYFIFKCIEVGGCNLTYDDADGEWVEWYIEGDSLFIIHHGAEYNCCLDDIEITVDRSGSLIDIYEKEIAPEPCYCICRYDPKIEITKLLPGTYHVNLYHGSGRLVASLVINI